MFSHFLRSLRRPVRQGRRPASRTLAPTQTELLEDRQLLSSVTVNLGAAQDGTLYEDPNGAKANGAGFFLFAGPNASDNRRGLIQFDVADTVPEGAVITDVTLTLHNSGGIKNSRNVFLHPLETAWGTGGSDAPSGGYSGADSQSGDATWLHTFYSGDFWSTPGGDFADASASTAVKDTGFYEWKSESLIDDVQQWLDDPDSNHGWLLRSNESATSIKRFDSLEHPNASRRPELRITYEVPVSPAEIQGRKWLDQNVNGYRDASEPWLNGWTIELYDAVTGEFVGSTVTGQRDLNEDGVINPETEVGLYSFTTTPGTYEIREIQQAGWAQSYPGFSVNFGADGRPAGSGGMTLAGNTLTFDFDVDSPNGVPLFIEFYVPGGNGQLVQVENRPLQGPSGEDRVAGSVLLTSSEVTHLLNGDLTAAVVNSRKVIKASGTVQGTGSHIVTVSGGELVSERNFGNYILGTDPPNGPEIVVAWAARGIHFGIDEAGGTVIVIAPQSLSPRVVADSTQSEQEPVTLKQIASTLTFVAKRDSGVADALDSLFDGESPLDILI